MPIFQCHELCWSQTELLASIWKPKDVLCPQGKCYLRKGLFADMCGYLQRGNLFCGEPIEIVFELMAIYQFLTASTLATCTSNIMVPMHMPIKVFVSFQVLFYFGIISHLHQYFGIQPRLMGFYGGWSLKPQLGLSNAWLASNPNS